VRAVNLLPRESNTRRGGRRVDPFVVGGATLTVVVAAALAGGFALEHSHASSDQRQLATARAELARLQGEATKGSGTKTPTLPTPTVTQQQLPWEAALTSALSSRVAWDDVLAQLARVVPANVTVTTVTLGASTAGSTAVPGSAGSLALGGTAFNENGVAQLLSRLGLVPDLGSIALTSSTADPKTGVVTFAISAQVSPPTTVAVAAPAAGGTPS
jgi:Tfp pilus assembly protein PilN